MNQLANGLIQTFLPLRKREKINKSEEGVRNSENRVNFFNRHFKYELHPEEALMLSHGILDQQGLVSELRVDLM